MISIPQYLDFTSNKKTKEISLFFLDLLERKNKRLFLHSQQVANYASSIAAKLGLSPTEIGTIKNAALLHDIGHLSVPNVILAKNPYLTTKEMAVYKRHCIAGYSMLENMADFNNVIDIIKSHHEKWDGSGYPDRLKGVNIPLGARIIAVANHYDRNINPCTQQWQKTHQEAIKELLDGAGTDFDPQVVKAFIEAIVPGKVSLKAKDAPKATKKRSAKSAAPKKEKK